MLQCGHPNSHYYSVLKSFHILDIYNVRRNNNQYVILDIVAYSEQNTLKNASNMVQDISTLVSHPRTDEPLVLSQRIIRLALFRPQIKRGQLRFNMNHWLLRTSQQEIAECVHVVVVIINRHVRTIALD